MPENTAKRDPLTHLIGFMGAGDSYITDMEAAGQCQLVNSEVLPIDGPWDELEALGFVRGEAVDDLFTKAELPAGWKKEGSGHAMWSYVLDERGIQRVGVFYKAAFYDRKAHCGIQNVGGRAATDVLYGDASDPIKPPKWDVFTEDERAQYHAGLSAMQRDVNELPSIYGKYAARLNAALEAIAS